MGAMQMYEIGAELVFVVVLTHEMGVVGCVRQLLSLCRMFVLKNHLNFYYYFIC